MEVGVRWARGDCPSPVPCCQKQVKGDNAASSEHQPALHPAGSLGQTVNTAVISCFIAAPLSCLYGFWWAGPDLLRAQAVGQRHGEVTAVLAGMREPLQAQGDVVLVVLVVLIGLGAPERHHRGPGGPYAFRTT